MTRNIVWLKIVALYDAFNNIFRTADEQHELFSLGLTCKNRNLWPMVVDHVGSDGSDMFHFKGTPCIYRTFVNIQITLQYICSAGGSEIRSEVTISCCWSLLITLKPKCTVQIIRHNTPEAWWKECVDSVVTLASIESGLVGEACKCSVNARLANNQGEKITNMISRVQSFFAYTSGLLILEIPNCLQMWHTYLDSALSSVSSLSSYCFLSNTRVSPNPLMPLYVEIDFGICKAGFSLPSSSKQCTFGGILVSPICPAIQVTAQIVD